VVQIEMKKKLSERRKHCALAVVRLSQKKFAPPQTPFPGAQDGQNLISWRWSLPLEDAVLSQRKEENSLEIISYFQVK